MLLQHGRSTLAALTLDLGLVLAAGVAGVDVRYP
jgi:hypothetical protein